MSTIRSNTKFEGDALPIGGAPLNSTLYINSTNSIRRKRTATKINFNIKSPATLESKMKSSSTKFSIIFFTSILLTACADLGPIRDYAQASKDLTSGTEVITRWKNSDIELTKSQPLFDEKINNRRKPEQQNNADEAAGNLIKIHIILGKYFSAVSLLADDGLPSVKVQSENLSNSIKLLDPSFNDADQLAFKALTELLSIPLEAYRQKEVIKLIKSQDANVERLLTVLEQASIVIESDIENGEAEQSMQPYNILLGDVKDKGVRFLVREKMYNNRSENYQPVLAAIKKYRNAISSIKEQHKKIADTVTSDKDSIKQLSSELKDVKLQIESAKKAVEEAIAN